MVDTLDSKSGGLCSCRFDSDPRYHNIWKCGRSSAVEHNLAKVRVDGSIPFARSINFNINQSKFLSIFDIILQKDFK